MLTILFLILFFSVFGGILRFAVRAAWGLMKGLLFLIVLPIVLIALLIRGVVILAIPVLVILGIVFLVRSFTRDYSSRD